MTKPFLLLAARTWGLTALGVSLGFALDTLLILKEKVSGKGASLPGHRQQKVAFPNKQFSCSSSHPLRAVAALLEMERRRLK